MLVILVFRVLPLLRAKYQKKRDWPELLKRVRAFEESVASGRSREALGDRAPQAARTW
jgi:hypothetical protein